MIIKKILFIFLLPLVCLGWYSTVDALSVYVEKPSGVVQVGDTVVIKVHLDTEEKEINALEGTVSLSGDIRVDAIHTGGSVFTLWPLAPVFKNQQISFVGGTPSSVFGGRLNVFTIAFTPQKTGIVTFDVSRLIGYLADGTGTPVASYSKNITIFSVAEKINDSRNDLKSILENDTNPPQKFSIEYTKDPSVYDGKVFLSFYTTDAESGVQKYEVIEEGKTYMVTDNVYVLKNQNLEGDVTVVATDTAGNTRSEHITFGAEKNALLKTLLIALVLILIRLGMWWFRKKRDEKI